MTTHKIDFNANKLKTNFCRDILKQTKISSLPTDIMSVINNSQKFILPDNGIIFESRGKTIDKLQLQLPFDCIALEFFDFDKCKNVIFATQCGSNCVQMFSAYYVNKNKEWGFSPVFVQIIADFEKFNISFHKLFDNVELTEIEEKDFFKMMFLPLIEFLEALSCKNVSIENHASRKTGKSKLDALPFDEYKILCVNVNKTYDSVGNEINETKMYKSPREHLRRGHIRRLQKGNVWVQSTVVNFGIGSRIKKSYKLTA